MAGETKKTFEVTKSDGSTVKLQGTRAEQDKASSRVTIFDGDDPVGSFINVQGWNIVS